MAITLEWLEVNANGQSFERGEDIFAEQGIKVTKTGNTYTAKVRGQYTYQVEITDNGSKPKAECSCPYDWGGYCKHIVAVGLTIIEEFEDEDDEEEYDDYDEEYDEEDEEEEENPQVHKPKKEEKPVATPVNATTFLEKTFLKSDIKVQKTFLLQLFTQNPTFITQFEAFIKPQTSTSPKKETIASIAEKVCKVFSEIDMEKVQRKSGYYHDDYYDDESGEPPSWATEKLEELFQPYYKKGISLLENGELSEFFTHFMGVYEGLLQAEEPIFDDYDLFDYYNNALEEMFSTHLDLYIPLIEKRVIKDEVIVASVKMLLDRAEHCFHYEVNEKYNFLYWENFLMAFISSRQAALPLFDRFRSNAEVYQGAPKLQMKLAKLLEDRKEWAIIGESYLLNDELVLREMFGYYEQQKDETTMVRLANLVLQKSAVANPNLLLEYIRVDMDKDLHIMLLGKDVFNQKSLSLYQKYAELASPSQKEALINQVKNTYYTLFYMTILAEENRHAEIIPLMGKVSDNEIPKMLKLMLENHTEEAWSWTKILVVTRLESPKRDRNLYSVLAKSMAVFLALPTYKARVRDFAAAIMEQYKRLIALRDEMRRAGLL